jgi:coproporphyrinogen III oxidase-like Fe-S oxidoreductase
LKQDEFLLILKGFPHISPETEITIESNPEDIDISFLEMLKDIGCTRLSIGVQTLSERSLSYI